MTNKTESTDDLLAQLDNLGSQASRKPAAARPARQGQPNQSSQSEQDLLAELGNLAHRPASRPGTPSQRKETSTTTKPAAVARTSEEKVNNGQRKSADSLRSYHQSFTPATTSTDDSPDLDAQPVEAKSSGGGWWGGILSTATAAVSQAQAAVKEIQKNEEAQKWADQVKGNVSMLRGFGMFDQAWLDVFNNTNSLS